MEEGKAARKYCEENDAGGPDVELGGLCSTFEENFWGAEATRARTVGSEGRPSVVFRVAVDRVARVMEASLYAFVTLSRIELAYARKKICTLPLGKAEVNEHTTFAVSVVEEIGGFNVPMEDVVFMDRGESCEQGAEVASHVRYAEVTEVSAEVGVPEVR